ncbi:Protein of uncharacterised function (DUF2787) [Yersinia frederiksenii]|uniref:DUF2787 family protein n=1 Tax=Yersinia frederiksenii TaxID=29484 RepID=UPI0005E460BE|nr:DUF2787 family protein [Yersinia frederiksenii]CNB47527.1 Protein of uncharacterised function (DUF2787) [Yersinia frederiksenii]
MNTIHQEGYSLPVKQTLIDILFKEMGTPPPMKSTLFSVSFVFRDIHYSPDNGGYHPVEIRLAHDNDQFYFDYITDLAYMGNLYPELEKEIDFSWSQRYAFYAGVGDLTHRDGCELFALWQSNFINYWQTGVYTSQILWES